mmetsp:Transcript_7638/g.17161  ORF Transcript_7638/g.17161 Transcript_7638/m.17161 type:complete len:130 (-) Transcript_7638:213-602(-)
MMTAVTIRIRSGIIAVFPRRAVAPVFVGASFNSKNLCEILSSNAGTTIAPSLIELQDVRLIICSPNFYSVVDTDIDPLGNLPHFLLFASFGCVSFSFLLALALVCFPKSFVVVVGVGGEGGGTTNSYSL